MSESGIGARVLRVEDQRFLTGRGSYIDDINVPGQAYAYFLRSPHAHATLKKVDGSAAASAPGVTAVLTGDDIAAAGLGGVPCGFAPAGASVMVEPPRPLIAQGKVRFVGVSGYPQKIFRFIGEQADVDCVLSYNQYTLQNTRFADETLPFLKARGIGAMNAGPFSARLLTDAPLPAWLKEPEAVKAAARQAAELCRSRGTPIAKLALQFSLDNPEIATTIAGSANPANIRAWAEWAAEPLDQALLAEVQEIFAPVKNIGHTEGLPENN